MRNRARLAAGILFACAALLPPGASRLLADQTDRTHQIGSKLKCMCNGCDQAAGKCYHVGGAYSGPCDTAKTMLKEIDTHIAAGMDDQQVLDAMIKQYGPLAYVEPPKTGFGLVAWLMPILYLLGGPRVGGRGNEAVEKAAGSNRLSHRRERCSRFAGASGSSAQTSATRDGGVS